MLCKSLSPLDFLIKLLHLLVIQLIIGIPHRKQLVSLRVTEENAEAFKAEELWKDGLQLDDEVCVASLS